MLVLPDNTKAIPLTLYTVILLKDIETSDDMSDCFDDADIVYTGKYEGYGHGKYEVIQIKKGTKASIQLDMLGNNLNLFPRDNKQNVLIPNAVLGVHFDWDV